MCQKATAWRKSHSIYQVLPAVKRSAARRQANKQLFRAGGTLGEWKFDMAVARAKLKAMKDVITLHPADIDQELHRMDYSGFVNRQAVRSVILDSDKRVLLLHVANRGYYMLSGGGTDGEDIHSALRREILEETGLELSNITELGKSTVYFDRWRQKQTDYCYVATVASEKRTTTPLNQAANEIADGQTVVWADSIDHAIRLISKVRPTDTDPSYVREAYLTAARDKAFLEEASIVNT